MNNLPDEVIINIIHYAGKSAKFINSRFYEISLDCKWTYKLIDLSTITIKELKKITHIEYIKIIVTKDRSKKELLEVIQFLFEGKNGQNNQNDQNRAKFKGIHVKVPVYFKSKDEIKLIQSLANNCFMGPNENLTILFKLMFYLRKQLFIKNLIIDLSESSHFLYDYLNVRQMRLYRYYFNKMLCDFYSGLHSYIKPNKYIYYAYSFDCFDDFSVINNKYVYIVDTTSINERYILKNFKNENIYYWNKFQYDSQSQYVNKSIQRMSFRNALIKAFGTDDLNKILRS